MLFAFYSYIYYILDYVRNRSALLAKDSKSVSLMRLSFGKWENKDSRKCQISWQYTGRNDIDN